MNARFRELMRLGVDPRLLHDQSVLHGGGKGAPPAPDYAGAATAQGQASKEATTAATWANRPTINTPWGQQSWQSGSTTDPSTGQPVTNWTSNITLSPEQQKADEAQQRITAGRSGAAEGLLGQAVEGFNKPVDWNALPKAPGSLGEAQQGAFSKMAAELQPGRTQREQGLETKLSNMGLPRGSEAWNRAKEQLSGEFSQQDKGLLAQSLAEGRADVGAQQGIRTSAIAEEAQRRGMTLNELNALLTGQQVQMPQGMGAPPNSTAGAATPANMLGAAQAQGQYQSANAGGGPDIGSLVGTGATIAGMFM